MSSYDGLGGEDIIVYRTLSLNIIFINMNFFSNDVLNGMFNALNQGGYNKGGGGNQKEILLRNNLEKCTYPDQVKYGIEKSVKQLFHVYPFFNPDLLMFVENGVQRRFIQLKGILEIQIKGKVCKVDFNMMLGADFPRSGPFIRIVNRNPDYKIDPFYKPLQSKTDPLSFVLNEKLTSVKSWHPSNSLVNVIIECYQLLKNRFPFSKPVQEVYNHGNGNNAWDAIYKKQDNFGGGGFNPGNNNNQPVNPNSGWGNQNLSNNNNNNNNWGNPPVNPVNNANNNWINNWGSNPTNNKVWAPTNPTTNNNSWGTNNNNNNWGSNNMGGNMNGNMGGNMGGMSGIIPGGNNTSTNSIAAAQKLVAKQKQSLSLLNAENTKLISKSQQLDILTKSLESQSSYLRRQNFQMTKFLQQNQKSSEYLSLASIVQPKDELSEQILDLLSKVKAREQCSIFLESKFTQQKISLEQFLKQLRKIEQAKFQQKFLLQKCIKHNA